MKSNWQYFLHTFSLSLILLSISCGGGASSSGGGSGIITTPTPQLSLPTTSIVLGPAAGTAGATLANTIEGSSLSWTAGTETPWIHLTDTGGATAALGSLVRFTYDANIGDTRNGSISFQGSGFTGTLNLTQAGVGYAPALPPLTTVTANTGASLFAVDIVGNIYFSIPSPTFALQKFTAATGQTSTIQLTGPSQCPNYTGFSGPGAVTENGDIFLATGTCVPGSVGSAMLWSRATEQTTLVATGGTQSGFQPLFATDWHGQNYLEICNGVISCQASTTFSYTSAGLTQIAATTPYGFASTGFLSDTSGNLYIGGNTGTLDVFTSSLYELNPKSGQNSLLSTLPLPQSVPIGGLARDSSNNLYFLAGFSSNDLAQWNPTTGQLTELVQASGVAGDGAGNVYLLTSSGTVQKFAPAFVNTTTVSLPATAGSGELPPVLPSNTVFNAMSDSSWLTITGQSAGIVTYSYTASQAARTAHITILNQTITVSQM